MNQGDRLGKPSKSVHFPVLSDATKEETAGAGPETPIEKLQGTARLLGFLQNFAPWETRGFCGFHTSMCLFLPDWDEHDFSLAARVPACTFNPVH